MRPQRCASQWCPTSAPVTVRRGLQTLGYTPKSGDAFDTLSFTTDGTTATIAERARMAGANLRIYWDNITIIALDETTTRADIAMLWKVFASPGQLLPRVEDFETGIEPLIPQALLDE